MPSPARTGRRRPILVTGGTGRCGSAVATRLTRDGIAVRLLSRHAQRPLARALRNAGIEIVSGDLLRPDSVAPWFKGIRRAYLVTPPAIGYPEELSIGVRFIQLAKACELSHLVFQSVIYGHTQMPYHGVKGAIELRLKRSGVAHTILRPGIFLEPSLAPFWRRVLSGERELASALRPDLPYSWISIGDVAETATRVLGRDRPENKNYALVSPEPASLDDMADVINEVLGLRVRFLFKPRGLQDTSFPGIPAALERMIDYPIRKDYYHPINRRQMLGDPLPLMRDFGMRFLSPLEYVRQLCRAVKHGKR